MMQNDPYISEIGDAQLGHSVLFTFVSFELNLIVIHTSTEQ